MIVKTRSDLERELGLEYYVTTSPPIRGKIRCRYEDFIVEEVLRDGTVITIDSCEKVKIPIRGPGNYIRAILVKRGCDTLSAVYLLSRVCKVPFQAISYLGLKDARALSAQLISIKDCKEPSILLTIKKGKVEIAKYVRSPLPLKRHELYGNRFTIIIRKIPLPPEEILSTLTELLKQVHLTGGFPAYFGHQRFGTIKPISHKVGKAIIMNDIEGAISHILTNLPEDFTSQKLNATYSALNYEVLILKHLMKKRDDLLGAFKKVPIILQRLFIHAYQSYLFNKMLSARIRLGLPLNRAVVGDLVGFPHAGSIHPSCVFLVEKSNIEKVNRLIEKKLLSVVLPVLGYATIKLPKHKAAEPVISILEEEGVSADLFSTPHAPKLKCPGTYRPLTFIFEDFKVVQVSPEDESSCSLKMRFKLRRGFYATVALREIIKPKNVIECGF